MHNTLLVALTAGLGGMLGWGVADFFAKKTIDRIGDLKSLVWGHGFGALLFIVIALVELARHHSVPMPSGAGAWVGLLFFGLLQMVVYWLVYKGFGKGQLAVLNPVFASFPGIVALVSILFLGEHFHLALGVSLIAVFAGIMLLNLDLKALHARRLTISPGLKEVALAALLAAGWTLGWNSFSHGQNPLTYALFMYVFMSLSALLAAAVIRLPLRGIDRSLWKFLIGIGAGETIAYLSITWGYSATTRTSVVALISGSFSLPTILLARLFLGERITKTQIIGVIAIIAGIVGLAIG